MLAAMERAGAVRLQRQRDRRPDEGGHRHASAKGEHKHDVAAKDFIGQDAAVLAKADRQDDARPTPSCSSARPTSRTRSCRSSR